MRILCHTIRSFLNLVIVIFLTINLNYLYAQTDVGFSWVKDFQAAEIGAYNLTKSISIDSENNLIISGRALHPNDFDPGEGEFIIGEQNDQYHRLYITKLTESGEFLWAKDFYSIGHVDAFTFNVVLDDDDNVIISGKFENDVDFDPSSSEYAVFSAGGDDAFICKLDSDGDFLWANTISGPGNQSSSSMAIDDQGDIVITGLTEGAADFDPSSEEYILSPGSSNVIQTYISKYNNDGELIWAKLFEADTIESASGFIVNTIDLDSDNNIHLGGFYTGNVDFDPSNNDFELTSLSSNNGVICKLTDLGQFEWVKEFDGNDDNLVLSMAIDSDGDVISVGRFKGLTDFDPSEEVDTDDNEGVFINKLNSDGEFSWNNTIVKENDNDIIKIEQIVLNDSDIPFFIGSALGNEISFDPNENPNTSFDFDVYNTYLCSYSEEGDFNWLKKNENGNASDDNNQIFSIGRSLSINDIGDVFYCGEYKDSIDFNPGNGNHTLFGEYNITFFSKLVSCDNITFENEINTVNDNQICGEGNVLLSATANEGSVWWYDSLSNGNLLYVGESINPYLTTTTTFYIEDVSPDECAVSDRIPITASVFTAVDASSSVTNSTCYNSNSGSAEIFVNDGTPPYTYEWSNNSEDSFINNLAPDNYTYTVYDSNNCSFTDEITISEPDQILISYTYSEITSCSGNCNTSVSLTTSGGTLPYSYLWNEAANFQNTSEAIDLCPGTYSVDITDANNCVATFPVSLTPVSSFDSQIFLINIAAVDQNSVSPSFSDYYLYDLPVEIIANATNPRNLVDPGKYSRFKVQAQNQKENGQSIVSGMCKVRSNNPYIELTDSLSSLNNIGWDANAWSGDEFEMYIDSNALPSNIYLDYIVVENQIEYVTSCIAVPLHPLVYDDHPAVVDDDDNPDSQGNGNSIVEVNETVEFYPWLQNISGYNADYVRGELENLDNIPLITIWNDVEGVNTTVYSSTWWNYAFGAPATILADATDMTPEFDFVFDVGESVLDDEFPLYTVLSGGFQLFNTDALSLVQWSLPYTFSTDISVGIDNSLKTETVQVLLYPNPTDGNVFIELLGRTNNIEGTYIEIFNSTGTKQLKQIIKSTRTEIQLDNLNPGLFTYLIYNENGKIGAGRFIVL